MSSSLIQVALSGIHAASAGLATTGQNISNANTAGFSRQTVVQAAAEPVFSGGGYIGSGVNVETVKRSYSAYLTAQVQGAAAQAASAAVYADGVEQLNTLIGDPARSASTALSDFFSTVHQLAANPSDAASRQSTMASAQTLVQRVNGIASGLADQRGRINDQLGLQLEDFNAQTREIAALNGRIAAESASGRTPNDLLDQRDQALAGLNKTMRATAVPQADGTVSVYLANGQAVVVGGITQKLALVPNALQPGMPHVGVKSGSNAIPLAGDTDLGGEVGGLLALRDDVLAKIDASIGRIARVFAEAANAQNRLGQDLRGNAGTDLFVIDAPLGQAAPGNAGNGSVSVSVSTASALAASDYRIAASGSDFVVTRLSDGEARTFSTPSFDIDGLTITMGGNPVAGDTFLVSSASGAASSLRMASTDAARLATGYPVNVSRASTNKGDAVPGLTVTSAGASLRDTATVTFNGNGKVTIATASSSETRDWTPGSPVNHNGWSLAIAGTPAAGDSFTVAAATNTPGDNRNAVALATLVDAGIVGGASFTGAYGQIVATLGATGREAEVMRTATASLASEATKSRDSVAGVNLDEEAMNMMRYQQAYQAAGKMVAVSNTLFESILQVTR